MSASGAFVGEARDETGAEQGEEAGGKPLRTPGTSSSIAFWLPDSVLCLCMGPGGPAGGPRCRGSISSPAPAPPAYALYTYSHALLFCHCLSPGSAVFCSRAQESQVHSRSHTRDRKCRPSQPSRHFRCKQTKNDRFLNRTPLRWNFRHPEPKILGGKTFRSREEGLLSTRQATPS